MAERITAGTGGLRSGMVGAQITVARLPLPVLLYLLAVVLPIGFQLGPLAMTLLRVLLLILVVPLTVQLLSGRFGKVFLTDILFIAHILWATLALAVNNPDQVIQQIGSVGVEFIGGYVLARAYVRTPEVFLALARALVVIVLCSLPFALHETLTGRPLLIEIIRKLPGVTSVAIVTIEGRMGLERVQLSFAHPIHYGLFCSVAFSLAFVALKGVSSTGWRFLSSAIVASCGFLALSSGALLAIFLQIGLILWAAVFAGVRQRWYLLLGLFALAYVVIDIFSNRTPLKVFMSYATFSAHNAYWRGIIFEWGMKNVWGSPIFGIGLNDWVRPWYMTSGSMDNFWLVMAVRYGIPGFVLIAVGYAWAVWKIMRRNFEGDAVLTRIRLAWVFTFLGLSFTLCTVHVWTSIYSFVFFMFGAGMWLLTAQPAGAAPALAQGKGSVLKSRRPVPSDRPLPAVAEATPASPTRPSLRHTRFPSTDAVRRNRGLPASSDSGHP